MATPETSNPKTHRPPLTRHQRRRYGKLRRKYQLSPLELCVWLLRVHERASFAQAAEAMGMTTAQVREIDRSMTARALSQGRRGGRDDG